MAKTPKAEFSPVTGKLPSVGAGIRDRKDVKASWQINRIDIGGSWGFDILKKIQFDFSDDLILEVAGDRESFFGLLADAQDREFESLSKFLEKLENCEDLLPVASYNRVVNGIKYRILFDEILPKLKDFEGKTWFEIEEEKFGGKGKTKHHFVNVENIIKEAQKRLKDLGLEHIDELFSLRLTGKIRIWGIREHGYLKILWFDLGHAICPVSL